MTQAVALAQQASTGVSQGFKNRIINGAMVIDQRNAGASVTPTSDATYTLDRWICRLSQSSKYSVQQNAGSVTPPVGFKNYLGITSLAATSIAAGDYYLIEQRIEGFNTFDLDFGTANAKTITISFWVRSSLTGTFGGAIGNAAFNRSYPFTYTISSANTWEQKSITIAGDTTGTWVGATNAIGLAVYLGFGVGSTYSGTAGSWQSAGLISATGATSVVGTNGATFYITGVQLEVGSTVTSFDYRPYGTELVLCQRYYFKKAFGAGGGSSTSRNNMIGIGFNYNSTLMACETSFPVSMRTPPAVSAASGTDYYRFSRNGANDTFNSLTGDDNSTTSIVLLNSSEISGTAGQAGAVITNDAAAFLSFDSEL